MAVGPPTIYVPTKKLILQGGLDVGSAALAAVLLTSSYTPNPLVDATWNNVSTFEATGAGYVAGGKQLASMSSANYGLSALSSINSGGSGYTQADVGKTPNLAGGTIVVAASLTITEVNNGSGTGPVTGIAAKSGGGVSLGTPGAYSAVPANPANTTGGGTAGSGLTINAIWGPVLTAANVSWLSSTITAKYIALVVGTAGALVNTDPLLLVMDLNAGGGSQTTSDAAFSVSWSNGILFAWG